MARLEQRVAALEQAQPNSDPICIRVIDGKDCDPKEDDATVLERECQKLGITKHAFEASEKNIFIRVVIVDPKPWVNPQA